MSRRRLSDDEHALWMGVARSVAPLRRRRIGRLVAGEPAASDQPAVSAAPKATPKSKSKPKPEPVQPTTARPMAAPASAVLGRRAKRRVARGSQPIDARLDLHGMTQSQAHGALLHFLRQRQERGGKLVLVITGKGGRDPSSDRGVLKRQVPMWLALPEFRMLVSGFEGAGVAHGGDGALYISLRRAR